MRDAPRRFTQPALLFVALALVAVLGWSNRSLARENGLLWDRAVRPYRGFVVPAFTTRTTDGREVVVAEDDSSKSQLLFVFSKACHFCAQTLPTGRAIDSALADGRAQVGVTGISLDSAAVAGAFASEQHLPYQVVEFPDLRTKAVYRAREVPLTMVMDGRGRVLYAATGLLRGRAAVDSVVAATHETLVRQRAASADTGRRGADRKT